MVLNIIQAILLVGQTVILIFTGYLVILMVAAFFAPRVTPTIAHALPKRFAILIPAHNEEKILPDLLKSIQQLDYPAALVDVHVIADNCVDNTAVVASSFGVRVHIRSNATLIGKGYALEWGLGQIRLTEEPYDAFIFIDADSIISPNFLQVMQNKVASGAKVIQAYYGVRDVGISWNVSMRYAALALLHFLRPQGRTVLGGSVGLKGNGMLFTSDVLEKNPWPASITEDIEYHMVLLLNGYTVKFAPDAIVWGEMPERFDQSRTQLDRWEYGRLEMARKYVPLLLKVSAQALVKRQVKWMYCYLDALMEHLLPPFSLLFGITLLLLAGNIAVLLTKQLLLSRFSNFGFNGFGIGLGLFLVTAQLVYLLVGLRMVHAPTVVYKQLSYAPVFLIRKIIQYLNVLSGSAPDKWIKTTRNRS